jgi:nitroreductase/NAD-dependent dihydropyrimidine dehydrogenase PreA subunit
VNVSLDEPLRFRIDEAVCNGCGQCAADCLAQIIDLADGHPAVRPEREADCYRCQHCLAVCPAGALSVFGLDPADSRPLKGALPDPEAVETLVLGRRSVRRYRSDAVDPLLIDRLLAVAHAAPSAHNDHALRFTLVDGPDAMNRLRNDVLAEIGRLDAAGALPPGAAVYAAIARHWRDRRIDILFREAPYLLIASAPRTAMLPVADGVVALTTFDLVAQAFGLGTFWNGLFQNLVDGILPGLRAQFDLPEDHALAFSVCFGRPAVRYARTVQRGPAAVHRVG